jgi:hypothetical protein
MCICYKKWTRNDELNVLFSHCVEKLPLYSELETVPGPRWWKLKIHPKKIILI